MLSTHGRPASVLSISSVFPCLIFTLTLWGSTIIILIYREEIWDSKSSSHLKSWKAFIVVFCIQSSSYCPLFGENSTLYLCAKVSLLAMAYFSFSNGLRSLYSESKNSYGAENGYLRNFSFSSEIESLENRKIKLLISISLQSFFFFSVCIYSIYLFW